MKCLKTGCKILIEPPYAYVLNNSRYHTNCAYCLTNGQLHKCLGCHLFKYCSKICQEKDWREHKWECKNIQNVDIKYRNKIPSTVLLMSRILYKIRENNYGSSVKSFVDDNLKFPPGRGFDQFVSHKDEHLKDVQNLECFNTYTIALSKILPKHIFSENVSKLFDIYCKVKINACSVLDNDLIPVANAIYTKASYFNHSCLPNTNVNFNGPDIIISLAEDVYIDENENFQDKIFISYIIPIDSYKNRQRSLNERYYFKCHCKLCTSRDTLDEYDWSAFSQELRCTVTGDQVEDIEAFQLPIIKKLINKLSLRYVDMDQDSMQNALDHNPFPVSNNVLYNKCLMDTMDAKQHNEKASFDEPTMLKLYHLGLAFKNGNALNSYYPYNSVTRVAHLLWLAKLARYFNDLLSATSYFNEAQNIYNTALSPKPLDGTVDFHNICLLKSISDTIQNLQQDLS